MGLKANGNDFSNRQLFKLCPKRRTHSQSLITIRFRVGKNRGSMDPVNDRGSMDPVHILMDLVHGPGPRRGSMDQGSMLCTFPDLMRV